MSSEVAFIHVTESFIPTDVAKRPHRMMPLPRAVFGALRAAVSILRQESPSLRDNWLALGRSLDVFVAIHYRMSDEHVQFSLPTEFVAICAELGLGIEVDVVPESSFGAEQAGHAQP